MKIGNLVLAGILALTASVQAADTGSCYSSAASLKASQTVKLVAEYDKEMYEGYDDSGAGVYYAKIKLSKGQAYTIWITGGNTENVDLDVDINWDAYGENDTYPMATFDVNEYNSGATKAATLYASDWDEEDPSSATYYVTLSGDLGDTVGLYYQTGIKAFVLDGEESNPVTLTMKDSVQSKSAKCVEGEYWFKAKLTAGRLYKVTTLKGTEDAPLGITMDGDCPAYAVPDFTDENNDSQFFEPETTANYKFYVDGADSQAFTLKYQSVPQLAIAKHTLTGELASSNDYVVAVTPGALHASYDYWDAISDSALVKVTLAKGERWVFETSGATVPIELRVYDSAGTVLASNDTVGNLSKDCRAAITASAAGVYYVGVFDSNLDVGETATSGAISLIGRNCATIAAVDAYDPADDAYTSANQIYAANAAAGDNVYTVGSTHGPHALNGGDWYDYFALPCRSGVTYELRAEFAGEESVSTLTLAPEVFYIASGKKVTVKTTGDLTPMGYVQEEAGALKFTAAKNLTYYIGVHVAEGVGLDYPSYNLRAMAYRADGTGMGLLQVKTKGAEGSWYLNSEKLYYANGAIVNLPTNTTAKIVFQALTGFATPASQTATMAPATVDSPLVLTGVYNDSYDSYVKSKKTVSDDNTAGAVTITAKSTTQTAKRTLWTTDPQDMFLFKASAGVYYNFKLVDTTLDGTGDAVFTITEGETTNVTAATTVSKRLFNAGNHYLTVAHADATAPVDTSYTLEYSAFNAGTVKFSAATYTVKESAATASVVLKRTAKEGRLRVHYATVQGASANELENARPGQEYYPAEGIVEWANGDMKDKTIGIRLIPDQVAVREANKSFTVKIWAMDEDDIEDDEYPAQITLDTAKVTIAETTAAKAGTVSVTAYGDEDEAIANVKKPAFAVTAGDDAILTVSRTGGSNGRVAVKWTATKGKSNTARAGVDFEADSDVLVWEDGDAADKTITVTTLASSDLTASRTFTVSLAAQTTGAYAGCVKPTLSATAATVTIKNDTYITPFATVQKAAKSEGVTMSAKGTWFVDDDGDLRCAPAATASVTFQVTGPGVFIASPSTSGCGTLSCRIGSGETFYPEGAFARAVPAGKQNIVFAYTDGDGTDYPTFEPVDEETGALYRWVPFSKFAAYEPFSKSVNQPGVTTNLAWTVPAELEAIPMYYRVRHGLTAKTVTDELGWTADSSLAVDASLAADPSVTHYWALDFAVGPDKSVIDPATLTWTAGGTTWSFATAAAGAVTTDTNAVDAYGESYYGEDGKVAMETIHLVKGVAVNFEIGPSGSMEQTKSVSSRVYSGALPTGLTLDGRAGMGVISGVPTKVGSFTAVLQTAVGTAKNLAWGSTITLRFEVEDTGTAVGTFFGALKEDGQTVERAAPSVGSITLTSAATGKLSAKVVIAGLSYTFSGTGFTVLDSEETEAGLDRTLQAELLCVKKYSKVAYTNVLTVTVLDAPLEDLTALGSAAVSATLEMNVPNAAQTAVTEGVTYQADLYRLNTANADYLAAMAEFQGYYTLALVPEDVDADDGLPMGNGYLTLKLTNKGVVTLTGRKADGTTLSYSGNAAIVGNPDDPSTCQVCIPFAASTSTTCLGGSLTIVPDENGAYVESETTRLTWGRDGSGSTEDASGFLLSVVPAGGWYNTTDTLQRYYLDYDFTLDGTAVTLTSNAVSLGAKAGETVSAMTYTLNRTTGIATGTLTSYSPTQKKNVTKCPHYGILMFTRDPASPLTADVWTAGFYLRAATKTWNESLPFNILCTEVDRDWSEATLPPADDE